MAAKNFPSPILDFTLREEGGFSDDPDDPGGATEHGVTLRTFRNMMHDQSLTVADLKAITPGEEMLIYRPGFWTAVSGDAMPSGVDLMVFDFGVNAGPGRSEECLQRAVGVEPDGIVGPVTLKAVEAANPAELVNCLAEAQRAYYEALAEFSVFGKGWLARTERRRLAALELIPSKPATTDPTI